MFTTSSYQGEIPRSREDDQRRGTQDDGRVSRGWSREAMDEVDKTRGAHTIFVYLKKVYEDALLSAQQADGNDEQVVLHILHALRAYLLYLVGTVIFLDKSATYTDVIYLCYR